MGWIYGKNLDMQLLARKQKKWPMFQLADLDKGKVGRVKTAQIISQVMIFN